MKNQKFSKSIFLIGLMFFLAGCDPQQMADVVKSERDMRELEDGMNRVMGLTSPPNGSVTSDLWGANGEKWDPAGRLPNFSMAGYHNGERALPNRPVTKNVKSDFGARGNGSHDDTQAIKNAINSLGNNDVLYFPEGTYKLSDKFLIDKSHVVLRGAGKGKTILSFTRSLQDISPKAVRYYSANEGLITIWGRGPETLITRISSRANRGDNSITVQNSSGLRVGNLVVVALHEPAKNEPGAGTLADHLNGELGITGSNARNHNNPRRLVSFNAKITGKSGSRITLNRTLPTDINLRWHPEVHKLDACVKEFGLESMTLKFPDRPWAGHHVKDEYNALALYGVANSWVKDVEIRNADNGIFVEGATMSVIKNVSFTNYSSRGPYMGHYGIMLSGGSYENVVTGFSYQGRYYHDLSVTGNASLNVFENGSGYDVNMDHHRSWPHSNLFTNIDLGLAARPSGNNGVFNSGGSDRTIYGTHTAGYETFWNLRSRNRFDLPRAYGHNTFGPLVNFIGLNNNPGYDDRGLEWYVEQIEPNRLYPPNLYRAQLNLRLGREDDGGGDDGGGDDDDDEDSNDDDEGNNDDDDNQTSQISVVKFMLVNADNEQTISGYETLRNGAVIDLSKLPVEKVNLRALTNPRNLGDFPNGSSRGSVKFTSQDKVYHDNVVRYTMLRRGNGLVPGDYRVLATPYGKSGGRGLRGISKQVTFKIIAGNVSCPSVYEPVCASNRNTYSNQCEAEKEGQTNTTPGQCSNPGKELAIKAVKASDYYKKGNEPKNTLDRKVGTPWVTKRKGGTIRYELNAPAILNQVQIYFYNWARSKMYFHVEVSNNGSSWRRVLSNQASTGRTWDYEKFSFSPQNAKFLRLVGRGNSHPGNDWFMVDDVKLIGKMPDGPPVCPAVHEPVCGSNNKTYSNQCEAEKDGQTNTTPGECKEEEDVPQTGPRKRLTITRVKAKDYYRNGNQPENTLDGRVATPWVTQFKGSWIRYDLAQAAMVSEIQIYFYNWARSKMYFHVEVSENGSSWQRVLSNQSSTGSIWGFERFRFSPKKAKYIRLIGRGNSFSGNDWFMVDDVKVFGKEFLN